jgi:hypothetical protein
MDFEGASPNPPVLYRINEDGSQSVVLIRPDVWTVDRNPQHIVFGTGDDFGNDLYVADTPDLGGGPPTIWRVTPQGGLSSFVAGFPLAKPLSLRFGPGGDFGTDLYVLDVTQAEGRILRVAPDGTTSEFVAGLPGTGDQPFSYPDFVFTPDGQKLLVGIRDTIYEITPGGGGGGGADGGSAPAAWFSLRHEGITPANADVTPSSPPARNPLIEAIRSPWDVAAPKLFPEADPDRVSHVATDAVFQEAAISAMERASPVALLTPATGFARSHQPQPDPLAHWDAAVLDLLAENLLSDCR